MPSGVYPRPKKVNYVYPGYHSQMFITCDDPDKYLKIAELYEVEKEVIHDDHVDYILKGHRARRFHESFFEDKGKTKTVKVSMAAHHYLVGKSARKEVDRALKALRHCEKKGIKFDPVKKKRRKRGPRIWW
jgi:hypothetical protein